MNYLSYIKKCPACGTNMIFLKTSAGKNIPVTFAALPLADQEIIKADPELYFSKVTFDAAIHKTHFIDCTNPSFFRRKLGSKKPIPVNAKEVSNAQ